MMRHFPIRYFLFPLLLTIFHTSFCQSTDTVQNRHKITLDEAHLGNADIDLKLLESYEPVPENIRQFYLDARSIFSNTRDADFTNSEILQAVQKHHIELLGGPLLGNLKEDGVTLWLRPSNPTPIFVKVRKSGSNDEKSFGQQSIEPGVAQRIIIDGLISGTKYEYEVYSGKQKISVGTFKTSPSPDEKGVFKLAFGSDFHKIGLHNPNLFNQIMKRQPQAMMLLGDLAVDDRENMFNMHRSDYLLRDLSKPWQKLVANVPIYSSWDDHDYLNNDLSGIPDKFSKADQEGLRAVWAQNWNNPENKREGVYFNTRIGPVELIMLDTRSLRTIEERGAYGSYLGSEQLSWLKDVLKNSKAPFKIISSGTMWSDYISDGKDSWGTWDTLAREEIFSLIETENISGTLLISGDRHGARGFTIPRNSDFKLYEFEAGTLGGVPGPEAMAKDSKNQLFGYLGSEIIAFGEFTFDTQGSNPFVIFRLIDQFGKVLEEHTLSYSQLTPGDQK